MLDSVIICTTDQPENAALIPDGDQKCVPTFRGSEMNVLRRFLDAAEEYSLEVLNLTTLACGRALAAAFFAELILFHLKEYL